MNVRTPTVILICGKIAAGKTTYARELCRQRNAVLLSCDEVMLTLFGPDAGEDHDRLAAGVRRYLLQKALDILGIGTDVVLDWGFWRQEDRAEVRRFFAEAGFGCALHLVHPSEERRWAQIRGRNASVLAGETKAYYVDEGLYAKCDSRFQMPSDAEVDVRICLDGDAEKSP